ncbi:MAG: MerR family transcriptional regulator, partial [Acidobacteriota bacterium]
MSGRHPIRAASKLTGLSIDTLRSWERRYKAVVPERSERGRVYSDEQIQRLLKLRRAQGLGYAIGTIAGLETRELEELLRNPAPQPAPFHADPGFENQIDRILEAAVSFDVPALERHLVRLATWLEPRQFATGVILPLLQVVGERWHEGHYTVAQEHLVSAAVRNVMGTLLLTKATEGAGHPRILITSPALELHEFGLLVAALLAASRGWSVIYLGPNLPAREIIDAAAQLRPAILLVGITTEDPSPEILEEVKLIATSLAAPIHLWLGGPSAALLKSKVTRNRVEAIPDFGEL